MKKIIESMKKSQSQHKTSYKKMKQMPKLNFDSNFALNTHKQLNRLKSPTSGAHQIFSTMANINSQYIPLTTTTSPISKTRFLMSDSFQPDRNMFKTMCHVSGRTSMNISSHKDS